MMESLLMALLECGSMDLQVIEDVGWDLGEIVEELQDEGIKPTLNAITYEIFRKGQRALQEFLEQAIEYHEEMQAEVEIDSEEYEKYQEVIDELKSLDPEEDMDWFCNCLDTSCWLRNSETYRKYMKDDIEQLESDMGFALEEG